MLEINNPFPGRGVGLRKADSPEYIGHWRRNAIALTRGRPTRVVGRKSENTSEEAQATFHKLHVLTRDSAMA